jgi:hypothetical protein
MRRAGCRTYSGLTLQIPAQGMAVPRRRPAMPAAGRMRLQIRYGTGGGSCRKPKAPLHSGRHRPARGLESRRAERAAVRLRVELRPVLWRDIGRDRVQAGRNNVRSPFQSGFEISLRRTFRLSARFCPQCRLDACNLFNTPRFDAPNNNPEFKASYSDFPS